MNLVKDQFKVAGNKIRRTAPDGTVVLYADFSSDWAPAQRGRMLSRVSPSGDGLTVNWSSNGSQITGMDYAYTTGTGSSASVQHETYAYTYNFGSNRVSQVVQSLNGVAIRTVSYAYYSSSDANGNAGDLKYVTKRNGSGSSQVVGTEYYRWYTSNTSTGYAGGLKMYVGDEGYERAVKAYGNAAGVEAAADGNGTSTGVLDYANNYFEYDSPSGGVHRVTKEIAQNAGQGCSCGKTGHGTDTLSYATNTDPTDGRNGWQVKTTETLPDGNQNVVYTNAYGAVVLKVLKDLTANTQYVSWNHYNDNGEVTLHAEGNAVTGYSESFGDLVGYGESGSYLSATGRIDVTNYYTAADGVDATLLGYEKSAGYQTGPAGTFVPTESWTYTDGGVSGDGVWNVASDTTYPDASDATKKRVTTYAYTWYQSGSVNTAQVKTMTTSQPSVAAGQNGSAASDTTTVYSDAAGRPVWSVDGSGYITYTAYDPLTGATVKQVEDADPAAITNAAVAGPTRNTSLPAALNLATTYVTNSQGRWTKRTDANGNVSYKVYDDTTADGTPRSVKTYTGWNATTHQPTGPVTATIDDGSTGIRDTLTYTWTGTGGLPVDGSGVPTGAEDFSSGNFHVQSLTRELRNVSDQRVETRQYTDLGSLSYVPDPTMTAWVTLGTAGTNYLSTKYKFDSGSRLFQTTTPDGTIATTVVDARGLAQSQWKGTNNTGATEADPTGGSASGNNMVKVTSFTYDDNGNQLTAKSVFGGGGTDSYTTASAYDFRDRLSDTRGPDGIATKYAYDNLGEQTDAKAYADANSNFVINTGEQFSESATAYDDQGRVYRTADITAGGTRYSDVWYDARGGVIKTHADGQATMKTAYDGAGRPVATYTTDGGGDSGYGDADDVIGDVVLEQEETAYDAAGNALLVTNRRRFHDATATGALGTPASTGSTAKARVGYRAFYYDAADRPTAAVDVGTNGGSAYTRPSSVPTRSDTVLVTSMTYDAAGRLFSQVDPKGLETRTLYDLAGRTTKTIENYVDGTPSASDDRTTAYGYDAGGHLVTQTADLPGGTNDQTTQYAYGVTIAGGSGITTNDLIRTIAYPDPSTGAAATSSAGKEAFTYDRLGRPLTKTDRDGSVHTYGYDAAGRPTSDTVTTLATGVDGAVRRLDTAYDSHGNPYLFTSYAGTSTSSTVVNQVQRTYNDSGQVTAEYQNTSGAVNTSTTPKVQYAYATPAKGSRLTSVTYPNGRVVTYDYGTSGSLNDTIGRLNAIKDGSTTLESYAYLGLSTVITRSHPQPGINLTYVHTTSGDAGDPYAGLDRFDRVTDQLWTDGTTAVDENTYAYDRDGNVTAKANPLHTAFSEAYTYDGLNRLTAMTRGGSAYQSWSLDPLGNSSSVTTNSTTVSRTHDDQNRLTSFGSNTLAFDNNGNTTTDEAGRTLIYDAWNRLVEAKSGSTSLIRYAYDALGRQNKEGSTNVYFNTSWQRIEDRNASNQTTTSYAWSVVYVDAMIARDRDTDANGSLDERIYPTQDANWTITALISSNGTVTQRYLTDNYGIRIVLTPSYATTTEAYGNRQGFQGGFYDNLLTNLMLFRHRYYDRSVMRWLQEDPIGYNDGLNIRQFIHSNPMSDNDPTGLMPTKNDAITPNVLIRKIREYEAAHPGENPCDILSSFADDLRNSWGNANDLWPQIYAPGIKNGWLDVNHFLTASKYASQANNGTAGFIPQWISLAVVVGGFFQEVRQLLAGPLGSLFGEDSKLLNSLGIWPKTDPSSAFTYEDMPSNEAGANFGVGLKCDCKTPLSAQIEDFLRAKGAFNTAPELAPNWNKLPQNEQEWEDYVRDHPLLSWRVRQNPDASLFDPKNPFKTFGN